jgi:rRNA processing protein Gar1
VGARLTPPGASKLLLTSCVCVIPAFLQVVAHPVARARALAADVARVAARASPRGLPTPSLRCVEPTLLAIARRLLLLLRATHPFSLHLSPQMGTFEHSCEGDMVIKSTNDKIPYFNAPIYLENKSDVGKVDEIFGTIQEVYFSVKAADGISATSFKKGDKLFINPEKLLPLQRFLPQPGGSGGGGKGKGGGKGGKGGKGKGKGGGKGKSDNEGKADAKE